MDFAVSISVLGNYPVFWQQCTILEMHQMTCRRLRFDLQKRHSAKAPLISGHHCSVNVCMKCVYWVMTPGESKKDSILTFFGADKVERKGSLSLSVILVFSM